MTLLAGHRRVASDALAHLRVNEMADAHRLLANYAEDNDLGGHDGSWLRAAQNSLAYQDDVGARRCLLNVIESAE